MRHGHAFVIKITAAGARTEATMNASTSAS